KWRKKEGDKGKPGDVMAEIETDKARMEYEAVDGGTLAKIVGREGTPDVPVRALSAGRAAEGGDVKAGAGGGGTGGRRARGAAAMRTVHSRGLGLDEKAMEAVAKWKSRPGTKEGKAVTVMALIEVSFRLL